MKKSPILPPFKRLCVTIGNLPSSYVDSMSYYECIMWLCKYLKDTLIPAVNENAEAVNELIHWFENLDVQDEINNKLDEMAESGELEEIISMYLQSNAVISYNTLDDLVNAENLVDGMTVRTLGHTTYLDGLGRLYKIRNITNEDVVDGINIITINHSETLIAELIPEDSITKVNRLTNRKYIFIGDSYGNRTPSWVEYTAEYAGISENDYYKKCKSSYGFVANQYTGGKTFTNLLSEISSDIDDRNSITDIIVGGGTNDYDQLNTDILAGIQSFMQTAKTLFPNAKVSLGFISWTRDITLLNEFPKVLMCYTKVTEYGGCYINNSEYCWHWSEYFDDDRHPTLYGYQYIGDCIANYILTGSGTDIIGKSNDAVVNGSNGFTKIAGSMKSTQLNNIVNIQLNSIIMQKSEAFEFRGNGTELEIAEFTNMWIIGNQNKIPAKLILTKNDDSIVLVDGYVHFSVKKIYVSYRLLDGQYSANLNVKKIEILPLIANVPTFMN